ncbi:hypothetical protein F5883DRAFT_636234 [Diaporthe sp. PMI_573]|nr:hypothetical protein F5883DRAFT_636234 [Diaporthaceae sp. PMI_573]
MDYPGRKAKADRNITKHIGEPYDSHALVKQLQDLWLNDDDDVLEQILTSAQPEALSHLCAAQNSKDIIPLATAKDGREFLILPGLSAYSDWAGQYPMEFSTSTARRLSRLSDVTLAAEKITTYQNDALKEILAAVSVTEDAVEFREPVQVLQPKVWGTYKALIAEPIDLGTMQHMLSHNRYETMGDFRRHVELLEQNAVRYNGDRNVSIVTAAVNARRDIYRRMDEIPAEPPLGRHSETQIRRIIYADDHGNTSAARSNVGGRFDADGGENRDASHEGANKPEAEARHTDGPTFILPLGRLGVARKSGGDEVIDTPYIVVMDLESAYKPLWLYKDNWTPVGLPSDKKELLDFGGKYNFTISKLADDIDEWKLLPGCARRGEKGKKVPTLSWSKVQKLIRKTSRDEAVLFDVVEDQRQAAAAIEEGWNRSTESSEKAKMNNFVVDDDVSGHRDSDFDIPAMSLHKEQSTRRQGIISYKGIIDESDDTSGEPETREDSEPLRKGTRLAI